MSRAFFEHATLYEAEGLAVSMVEWPKGNPARFALVLGSMKLGARLYYFLTREEVSDLIDALVLVVGEDA